MDNLPDFISGALTARGDTITAFAARIGTTRQTVARWNASLPAAETLRRIADDLDVTYSQVLTAGLVSAGYVAEPADQLAGQELHAVLESETSCPECGGGAVVVSGVFSTPEVAAEYARVRNAIDAAEFEPTTVRVDAASVPPAIDIHTHTWSSRSDNISHYTRLVGQRPTRLIDRDISDIEVEALGDDNQIFELKVSSIDETAGRTALLSTLDRLRKAGQLLPSDIDPFEGRGSSWLARVAGLPYWAPFDTDVARAWLAKGLPGFEPPAVPPPTDEPRIEDSSAAGDHTGTPANHGPAVDDNRMRPGLPGFTSMLSGMSAPLGPHTQANTDAAPPAADENACRAAHAAAKRAPAPYVWGGGNTPPPSRPLPAIKRYTIAAPDADQIPGVDKPID